MDLIKKANKIDEIFGAVRAEALQIAEMNQFYCDADRARGQFSARLQLKLKIEQNAESARNGHFLFVGYRGCGKSTELNHLQKDLQDNYAVLNYSVMKELDPQSIEYIELFIVTMERLFNLAAEENLAIDKAFLQQIQNWTETTEIQNIKDKHFSAEASTGMDVEAGIPSLLKFFLKLKGVAKASKSFKETVKKTLEPRLADLIQHCNDLITEVRLQVMSQGKKDLVIFIEDLDKVPLHIAEKLFYNYGNQLTQLKATVVYAFPVALYYNINFGTISNYFADTIELPMVKIKDKNGTPSQDGIDVLNAIIDARINNSLFAYKGITLKFIEKSGGVIRDLFRMLNDAATAAYLSGSAAIRDEDYQYAYNKLKKDYDNMIADFPDDKGAVRYKAADFYDAMVALVKSDEKKPENSEIMMLLRQNLCVLSYNGKGWCDVHPVMKDILIERRRLN